MELCLGVFKRAISCLCHTFYNYQKYLVYFLLCEATIAFVWYEWMLHMYQARIHTVCVIFNKAREIRMLVLPDNQEQRDTAQ